MDGTIKLCEDLLVDPEDVVLLAIAYELKSPKIGEWNRKGWTEGWKSLGFVPWVSTRQPIVFLILSPRRCDTLPAMKMMTLRLRDRLSSDSVYFQKVYNHTFDFGRAEGQRSLGEKNPFLRLGHPRKGS